MILRGANGWLSSLLIGYHSYPFKEPGGDCLSAGGAHHALPGSHQAAGARLREGGGCQGNAAHQPHTGLALNVVIVQWRRDGYGGLLLFWFIYLNFYLTLIEIKNVSFKIAADKCDE